MSNKGTKKNVKNTQYVYAYVFSGGVLKQNYCIVGVDEENPENAIFDELKKYYGNDIKGTYYKSTKSLDDIKAGISYKFADSCITELVYNKNMTDTKKILLDVSGLKKCSGTINKKVSENVKTEEEPNNTTVKENKEKSNKPSKKVESDSDDNESESELEEKKSSNKKVIKTEPEEKKKNKKEVKTNDNDTKKTSKTSKKVNDVEVNIKKNNTTSIVLSDSSDESEPEEKIKTKKEVKSKVNNTKKITKSLKKTKDSDSDSDAENNSNIIHKNNITTIELSDDSDSDSESEPEEKTKTKKDIKTKGNKKDTKQASKPLKKGSEVKSSSKSLITLSDDDTPSKVPLKNKKTTIELSDESSDSSSSSDSEENK